MKQTCSVDINAPIERVFDFIQDPEKHKLWLQGVEETRYIEPYDPDHRVGTKFKQKIREGGSVKEYDGEVLAFEKPSHLGILLHCPQFKVRVDYRLTAVGTGTHLDYECNLTCFSWFFRVMAGLFSWFMRGMVRKQLNKLKELAEA